MALELQAQRQAKLARVGDLWTRHELPPVPVAWEVAPNACTLGYRNRVRCQVTSEGTIRFFNPRKHSACPVLEPSVLQGIAIAKRFAQGHPNLMQHFDALEVRGRDMQGVGAIVFRRRNASAVLPPGWARDAPTNWIFALRGDPTAPVQRFRFSAGTTIDVPVNAFLQVNHQVNQLLVQHVVDALVARGARSFADLYMGSGNFALPLLAAGLLGYGVERHAGAVQAARGAALRQGFSFADTHAEDAVARAHRWVELGLKVDAIVCNPPRKGLGPHARAVASLALQTIVLCSCNPESLCRDTRRLVAHGFEVDALRLFDMFPQTGHVEAVTWLTRTAD